MRIVGLGVWALLGVGMGSVIAQAQVDFTGDWNVLAHEDIVERIPGPALGDYLGIPLNAAARLRADSWDASLLTMPEWQCRPHSSDYVWRGPSPMRIWKEMDPVRRDILAWRVQSAASGLEFSRTVYLDDRPHPPETAAHTWAGFSTGKWDGDMLTVTVTHLKEGYIRRNGVERSDLATVTEHWIRNGNYLTVATIIDDPVLLTEPFIRTTDFFLDLHVSPSWDPCEVKEEVVRPSGQVPHHLPGTNPFLHEFADKHGVPFEATRGGAETMYPEYRKRMKRELSGASAKEGASLYK
ncbi:MAG: hypothetical protein M3N41_10850 [Acidobacteriota bacterium]|nr:hypothetical protein [Acidobacteriota bacterium]